MVLNVILLGDDPVRMLSAPAGVNKEASRRAVIDTSNGAAWRISQFNCLVGLECVWWVPPIATHGEKGEGVGGVVFEG